MANATREDWKIRGNVFDSFTERTVHKLISQGIIDGIESPIQIGKEANTFTALHGKEKRVVKIYRLESCNFNAMYGYIKSDPRFMDIKKQRRQIIFNWVLREHKNLLAARKAGVKVPLSIAHVNHVLVLEYIGDEEGVSPQLKDYVPEDIDKFFKKLVGNLKILYQKAKLVHADLSEFNILVQNDNPVIIDMSQATIIKDMEANKYMDRDLANLKRFFKKYGYDVDVDSLKKEIIG